MNISSDAGGIDSSKFLEYIAKQLPSDVAQMVAVRDELAKRQGSITAVDAANKKLADADAYAESTKAQADTLLADAKATNADSKVKSAALDAREKDLAALEKQSLADSAAKAKELATKEAGLATREDALVKAQVELKTAQDTLASDRVNLDARIKALQDKIASINI
jgi:chromosome segregation ATPase